MSNTSLACVVLAAGQGTRMNSKTPKVLHELAGKPMMTWLLQTLEGLSPEKIIVVTAPDADEVRAAVAPHETVIQEEINGTGGALKAALPALEGFNGNVLVVLGDAPLMTLQTLSDLVATRAAAAMTILGAIVENPTGYGRILMDDNGVVSRIVEEKDANAEERSVQLINTGALCVDGKYLGRWLSQIENKNAQGEYYLTDLPAIAAQDNKASTVCVTLNPSEVQGCNTRTELAILELTLQNRLRKEALESGVNMQDLTSVYFHHDTKIAPGVSLEPHVFFGPNVSVEEGATIKAFSHIEGAHIKKNAVIGPFARLRPGSEIGESVRIGNFVETKNSTIGPRSKIGHLAYVGDCIMGEDVNFSAGAITVNYDGFQKHRTTIGKGVMVGSNVNLVAPLSIDDGAFIAAGSTITVDVPADALSIARDSAEIRKGWAAEYRKRKAAIMKRIQQKKDAG